MQVKIKKLIDNAVIPSYSKPGDAGMDIVATGVKITENYNEYLTGLAIEIPEGYVGLIFPRSSISEKDLILANSVGVIDSQYRGEIRVRFKRTHIGLSDYNDYRYKSYNIGEKIAQLIIIPYPQIEFIETDELSSTERGEGGFGSTNV